MSIEWFLKKYLAKNRSIYSATELKRLISKRTGVVISLWNLCKILNSRPKMIRLETIEVICSALDCKLEDFCQITPGKIKKKEKEKVKLSYKNTPHSKRGIHHFPDPQDYG